MGGALGVGAWTPRAEHSPQLNNLKLAIREEVTPLKLGLSPRELV